MDENVEKAIFVGTGSIRIEGNNLANEITGGGDDRIDGRLGSDTTAGGNGNDFYVVDNVGDSGPNRWARAPTT